MTIVTAIHTISLLLFTPLKYWWEKLKNEYLYLPFHNPHKKLLHNNGQSGDGAWRQFNRGILYFTDIKKRSGYWLKIQAFPQ